MPTIKARSWLSNVGFGIGVSGNYAGLKPVIEQSTQPVIQRSFMHATLPPFKSAHQRAQNRPKFPIGNGHRRKS